MTGCLEATFQKNRPLLWRWYLWRSVAASRFHVQLGLFINIDKLVETPATSFTNSFLYKLQRFHLLF